MNWKPIISNIMWFIGSLFMASLVWFVATIQADPISTQRFLSVPIQIEYDSETLIVTNSPSETAQVVVRAQESVIDSLTREDIVVRADLTGRAAGTYTVPLKVDLARTGSADPQPLQVTVVLEPIVAEQKEVDISITNPPSLAFRYSDPSFDVRQAVVQGAQNRVSSVATVRGEIDLSDQRNTFSQDVTLVPVDENGRVVRDVTIEPRAVRVSVEISQREDVRPVSIQPRLGRQTEGYIATIRNYEPQFVFIGGTPESLRQVGDSIFTEEISLDGRTDDFQARVSLDLPFEDLVVLNEDPNIVVNVNVEALRGTLQLDDIPVSVIGQVPDGFEVDIQPDMISVVLVGPSLVLESIEAEDIQVFVDIDGLTSTTQNLTPTIQIAQTEPGIVEWSTLPQSITAVVTEIGAQSP